jgi:hypothetical protein
LFGYLNDVPKGKAERMVWTKKRQEQRNGPIADRFRPKLIELLGESRGKAVRFAEAFEVCEYGAQPSPADLKKLFPFFDEK